MSNNNIVFYIEIDGPVNQTIHAVEVYLTLTTGEKRWCFFLSPSTVVNCGDYIEGTKVRAHYGAKHMFVLSEVTENNIRNLLNQIDKNGDILECTIPIR